MPNKPAKYGCKFFNICDVKTAFLCDSIPYTGKSVENSKNETEIGKKMVENLSKRFYGTNRCLGIILFFTV